VPWLQLETKLGLSHPETLEPILEELGAVAVSLRDAGDEPILEPAAGTTPNWSSSIVTALFPADTNPDEIQTMLASVIDGDQLHFTVIEDRDWHAEWQQNLQPMRFGEHLWVIPAGLPQADTGVSVTLSPGMAFGTGGHPTTAMCLEWLQKQELSGATVIDYGCGSGLLAIAALKLGAASATAVDNDPQALEASRSNARDNFCENSLNVNSPEDICNTGQYDFMVANILSGTLISLSPALEKLLRPGAGLALSGILADQAEDVISAWSDWADLRIGNQTEDWILLSGTKHG